MKSYFKDHRDPFCIDTYNWRKSCWLYCRKEIDRVPSMSQSLHRSEMLAAIRRARSRSLAITDVKYSYDDECSARCTYMHSRPGAMFRVFPKTVRCYAPRKLRFVRNTPWGMRMAAPGGGRGGLTHLHAPFSGFSINVPFRVHGGSWFITSLFRGMNGVFVFH